MTNLSAGDDKPFTIVTPAQAGGKHPLKQGINTLSGHSFQYTFMPFRVLEGYKRPEGDSGPKLVKHENSL
jgi:hypothetical protein